MKDSRLFSRILVALFVGVGTGLVFMVLSWSSAPPFGGGHWAVFIPAFLVFLVTLGWLWFRDTYGPNR